MALGVCQLGHPFFKSCFFRLWIFQMVVMCSGPSLLPLFSWFLFLYGNFSTGCFRWHLIYRHKKVGIPDSPMFSTSICTKKGNFWWCHAQAWNLNKKLIAACSNSQDYSTRFWSRARPGDSNFEQFLPKRVGVPLPCLEKRNPIHGTDIFTIIYHTNQPFM